MIELPPPVTMLVDELATMRGVVAVVLVCNEKRLIDQAGLTATQALFAHALSKRAGLIEWLDHVASRLGVSKDETLPWESVHE